MCLATMLLLGFNISVATTLLYEVIVELLKQCFEKKIGRPGISARVFFLGMCLTIITLILAE